MKVPRSPQSYLCPIRPCEERTQRGADVAVVPYIARGDHGWDALCHHLERSHGLEELEASRICNQIDRDHEVSRIVSGAGTRFRDCTLETFPADDLAALRALTEVHKWWEEGNGGLYLHGTVGAGKTGLAVSLAKNLLAESQVEFINTRALLAEIKRGFKPDSESIDLEDVAPYYTDWIIFDDVGAERPTEWALDVIATLVEAHHARKTGFIVTSNYAPSALIKRLGHADLTIGRRIVSRLIDGATVIKLDGPDLRARRAAA